MTVNTQPAAARRATTSRWRRLSQRKQTRQAADAEEFGGGWNYNYDEVLRVQWPQRALGEDRWKQDVGPNWDEDEAAASSRTPTSSTCRGSATIARSRVRGSLPNDALHKDPENGLVCETRSVQGRTDVRTRMPV